jgi:SagB-type dehydrogenase family enzyme
MTQDQVAQDPVTVVRDYAEAVFHRGRVPMEPLNFQPNWHDQPSKHKTYLGVSRLPLPTALPDLATAGEVLLGPDTGTADRQGWTLDAVAAMLRLSYGALNRRLRVGWNQDTDTRIHYNNALWGRGTASGGGMYPLEMYWVAGGSGPLTPGVYHYSTAHHGLERLISGDLTDRVRAAIADETGAAADQFLLVTTRFWKNSYKYNSFCYHVVNQDAGALLGSWEVLARGMRRPLRRVLWFDDEALNGLLGLRTLEESVLAVAPLPWSGDAPGGAGGRAATPATGGPLIDRAYYERSQVILRFEQTEVAHTATLLTGTPRPDPAAIAALIPQPVTSPQPVPLPAVGPPDLDRSVAEAIHDRQSSFGAFISQPPLALDKLGTVLAGTASAQRYAGDVKPDAPLTRLFVLANRVTGLASGTYAYEAGAHRLHPIQELDLATFLQRAYYLTNYNLDQVAAVIAISANLDSALDVYGSRGYRVLNTEVGAVAQTAYLAASAAKVGCGAVLGFDNIAIDEIVGLDRHDERTFLFLLLGNERTDPADFDYRLA